MSTSTERIARELLQLRREVRKIQTQPRLAYSSVEGGYLLWNDDDGNPAVVVGQQFDGTNASSILTGPPPPMPTPPTGEAHLNSAKVNWDGFFIDALVPMNFSRVEIHAVDDPADTADTADTLVGTYETSRGGDTMVPISGPKYLKLVTRSTSGGRSDASDPSELITPLTSLDITAEVGSIANDAHDLAVAAQGTASIALTAANGKNRNFYQATAPPNDGTLIVNDGWFDLDDDMKPHRWDGTTWVDAPFGNSAIAELDAGKVTTGFLDVGVLQARSVSMDKLMIGSFDNLLGDPTFTQPLGKGWQVQPWNSIIPTGSRSGGPAMRITATSSDNFVYNLPLDHTPANGKIVDASGNLVKEGDSFLLTSWAKSSVAQTGNINMVARFKLNDGSFVFFRVADDQSCLANVWTQYYGTVTAPANTASVSFYFDVATNSGTVDVDYMSATRAATGELIVDGEIKGQHIAAKSLTTEHLVSDFFEAGFVYTGALAVGDITLNPTTGLQIPGPEGTTVFPTDGSGNRFAGVVITSSAQIKDDLTLSGVSLFNGQIQLANGATSPTNGPTITQYWPSIVTAMGDGSSDGSSLAAGLDAYHGNTTEYVYCAILFATNIRRIRKSDGGWVSDITGSWSSGYNAIGGLATVSTNYYLLGSDSDRNGDFYIYKIDGTTGSKTTEARIGNLNAFHGFRPRIVADVPNARVGMLWIPQTGNLMLRWFNTTTLAQVGSDIILATAVGEQDLGDAVYGDAGSGLGANTLWVSVKKSSVLPKVMCWTSVTTTTATRASTNDFKRANASQMIGMAYDSVQGRMVHVDHTGTMWTYSKLLGSPSIQSSYTFYDGDSSNYPGAAGSGTTVINGVDKSGLASGTHETLPSPTTTLAIEKRSWFTIETTPAPDEKSTDSTLVDKADRISLYLNNGGTLHLQSRLAKGVHSYTASPANTGDTMPTTGAVPTTNTFTTGSNPAFVSAGVIRSLALRVDGKPKNSVGGDGTGRLDGLIPPGCMMMWGGAAGRAIPAEWLLCDGRAVSRTTYADLFAAVSTTYGAGDGTTTFNLPNTTNRFLRGTAGGPGAGGGSDTATLPAHTHSIANEGAGGSVSAGTSAGFAPSNSEYAGHNHGGATGAVVGTPATIPTVPGYMNINYIIKT